MNDLLFPSETTVDPEAMARVANLLLESVKFHAPQYAWHFGRFRAIGDATVEAIDTDTIVGGYYKGDSVTIETRLSVTLASEFRNNGLIINLIAQVNAAAKTEFYSLGNFNCGAAATCMAAGNFTIETMNDAIQKALAELVTKTTVGVAAINTGLVIAKPMATPNA